MQRRAILDCRIQGELEGPVGPHSTGSQHVARAIAHLDGSAHFTTAADLPAGKANHQVGRCSWWGGVGRGADTVIRCLDGSGGRGIARCILGGHRQGLAVSLRRLQGDAEHTIGTCHGGAQQGAVGTAYLYGSARFGTAGERGALFIDGKPRGGKWCGHIRCRYGTRLRDVAGGILSGHRQGLAVCLRWLQGDTEHTVGTCHSRAQQRAVGAAHFDGGARLGTAGEGGALPGDGQLRRG